MNKDKKQYKKDIRKHQKELVSIAKNTFPWAYNYSLDFMVYHLKMMQDYYKVGYNVWSIEEDVLERKEIIDKMIFEYDSYMELPRDEREAIAKELGVEVDKVEDNIIVHYSEEPFTFKGKTTMCRKSTFEDRYYSREVASKYYNEVNKAEIKHYYNFVDMLKDDFRKLCD